MRQPWLIRLHALVLAVLFLGGGRGLPLLDAAFYHRCAAAGSLAQPRVDADDHVAHADYCTIGLAAVVARTEAPPPLGTSTVPALQHRDAPLPGAPDQPHDLGRLPSPRAPPRA